MASPALGVEDGTAALCPHDDPPVFFLNDDNARRPENHVGCLRPRRKSAAGLISDSSKSNCLDNNTKLALLLEFNRTKQEELSGIDNGDGTLASVGGSDEQLKETGPSPESEGHGRRRELLSRMRSLSTRTFDRRRSSGLGEVGFGCTTAAGDLESYALAGRSSSSRNPPPCQTFSSRRASAPVQPHPHETASGSRRASAPSVATRRTSRDDIRRNLRKGSLQRSMRRLSVRRLRTDDSLDASSSNGRETTECSLQGRQPTRQPDKAALDSSARSDEANQ